MRPCAIGGRYSFRRLSEDIDLNVMLKAGGDTLKPALDISDCTREIQHRNPKYAPRSQVCTTQELCFLARPHYKKMSCGHF
jgi:hypothetical protein